MPGSGVVPAKGSLQMQPIAGVGGQGLILAVSKLGAAGLAPQFSPAKSSPAEFIPSCGMILSMRADAARCPPVLGGQRAPPSSSADRVSGEASLAQPSQARQKGSSSPPKPL